MINPARFLVWWFVRTPKNILITSKRLLTLINNQMSFTLNIKLIFTPLYGDYTIVGRIIGFIFRVSGILVGLIVFLLLTVLVILLPLVWILSPVIMIYYIKLGTIWVITLIFLLWYLKEKDTPAKKISNNKGNHLDSFRPSIKKYAKNINTLPKKMLLNLLEDKKIKYLLLKTELSITELTDKYKKVTGIAKVDMQKEAFELARELECRYVEVEHLFYVLLKNTPKIDVLLSTYNSNLESIKETIRWIVSEREWQDMMYLWQEDFSMPPTGGISRGLTGRVTPILDSFSEDFTKQVKSGKIQPIIGRKDEIENIAKLLSGEKDNILLIGEPGSGKTSIIKGIAYNIIAGTDHKTLNNKRIISIDLGKMISGTRTTGEIATKITKAMDEVKGSKDIILFVDEIHELVNEDSSIFPVLEPYINSPEIQFIGATSILNYRKFIEPNGSFARLFQIIEIGEASVEDTLNILKSISKRLENKYKITITYRALEETVRLSKKLIHERVFPDKAIDILTRTAVETSEKVLNSELVKKIISNITHIPMDTISENDVEKLTHIEKDMKKMVIGQDQAIIQIANALKRAAVGIRDENKPIASFLFVGTTGVGKTQTAKALAQKYFGSKDTMIRIDMSEYQHPGSIDKLIGSSYNTSQGMLTEKVREKPFSLVLLDEIEKAYQDILFAFLQVLDDGRLTDSKGVTVDFTNTIIIATSNVGTREVQNAFNSGGDFEKMKEEAMKKVREHFAPEFLNRFTDIIVFNPLNRESLEKIALLLLENVKMMAKEKGVTVKFKPELIKEIVDRGYDPEWGARPMAREIENSVENYLVSKILEKGIEKGDEIQLGIEVYQKILQQEKETDAKIQGMDMQTHGFAAVAGMEKLKKLIIEDVVKPIRDPEKYKKFKLQIPNGILLYGPPGCGKTYIVKRLAEELKYNFVDIKHSDITSSYIHGSVGLIAQMFSKAKEESPSIVFIDEIEGLLPKRQELSTNDQFRHEEINELLMQLNDASDNNILVFGATNQPELIDKAILRSGRMDKIIYVPPPDTEARKGLLSIYLKDRPLAKDVDLDELAALTENYTSSDIELVTTEATRMALSQNANEISQDILKKTIEETTPSITMEDIKYYESLKDMERW